MNKGERTQLIAEVTRLQQHSDSIFSLASLVEVFARLSSIYRPSGGEQAVLKWIRQEAATLDLSCQQDPAGNLVVRVPGNQHSCSDTLVVQAHVDMVCVGPVDYDWERLGVQLLLDGEWLRAQGTSLGADNGAGVAMMILLMRTHSNLVHPPLELLFTVSEEIGLVGAQQLDGNMIQGGSILNLDTEDSDCLTDGGAGGQTCLLSAKIQRQPRRADFSWQLKLSGLPGGHSGLEIAEHHGNAVQLLYRCWLALEQDLDILLLGATAGQSRNIIPSTAQLDVGVRRDVKAEWGEAEWQRHLQDLLQPVLLGEQELIPHLEWQLQALPAEAAPLPLSPSSVALMHALPLMPDGVFLYNRGKQLVELSANLAQLTIAEGQLDIVGSLRYTRPGQLPWLEQRVKTVAQLFGFQYRGEEPYPSWPPSTNSRLRAAAIECYRELFGRQVPVKSVHGGLECGVVIDRVRQAQGRSLDALSMGPTIEAVHGAEERIWLPGWEQSARLFVRLLDRLAHATEC